MAQRVYPTFAFLVFLMLCFTCCGTSFALETRGIEPLDYGPIHEAYVTKVTGTDILQAVPAEPPQDINERIPGSVLPGVVWVPGYWAWSDQRNDFIWVSGVWRRPPPGHFWILGLERTLIRLDRWCLDSARSQMGIRTCTLRMATAGLATY